MLPPDHKINNFSKIILEVDSWIRFGVWVDRHGRGRQGQDRRGIWRNHNRQPIKYLDRGGFAYRPRLKQRYTRSRVNMILGKRPGWNEGENEIIWATLANGMLRIYSQTSVTDRYCGKSSGLFFITFVYSNFYQIKESRSNQFRHDCIILFQVQFMVFQNIGARD